MASFLLWPRKTRGNGTREASNPSVWPRKVVPKCSQTDEFHRFFLTKRDSTALFGLLEAVSLQRVFQTHGIYLGSRFRGPPGAHFGHPGPLLGRSWRALGASWGSFWPSSCALARLGRSCRARVPLNCRKRRSKSLFKKSFRNL